MKSGAFVVVPTFLSLYGSQAVKPPSKPFLTKKDLKQLIATAKRTEQGQELAIVDQALFLFPGNPRSVELRRA
jgi:hypothetical protein